MEIFIGCYERKFISLIKNTAYEDKFMAKFKLENCKFLAKEWNFFVVISVYAQKNQSTYFVDLIQIQIEFGWKMDWNFYTHSLRLTCISFFLETRIEQDVI